MTWMITTAGADTSPAEAENWSEAEETKRQLRRFLVVGLLSVAIDLSIYTALAGGLAFAIHWSKAVSYLGGVAVGFWLNKRWTFQSGRRTWTEPASYLLLYVATLGVNVGCNSLMLNWLVGQKLMAFLIATSVTTLLNFLGMRLVTFRRGIADRRQQTLEEIAKPRAA